MATVSKVSEFSNEALLNDFEHAITELVKVENGFRRGGKKLNKNYAMLKTEIIKRMSK